MTLQSDKIHRRDKNMRLLFDKINLALNAAKTKIHTLKEIQTNTEMS